MDAAKMLAELKAEEGCLALRIEAVRTSIAALEGAYASGDQAATGAQPMLGTKRTRARASTQTAQIRSWAEVVFSDTNRRFNSTVLAAEFTARGFGPIDGKNPAAAIASALSPDKRFDNASDEHGTGYGFC